MLQCCVPGCKNVTTQPSLTFFLIPMDQRRGVWLRLIGRKDLTPYTDYTKSCKVCSDHFDKSCLIETDFKVSLRKAAVPSLLLPKLDNDTENKNRPSTSNVKNKKPAITHQATQANIEYDTCNIVSGSKSNAPITFYDLCDKLNPELAAIFKTYNSSKRLLELIESPGYTKCMFELYKNSPQAYQFFQNAYNLSNADILLKNNIKINSEVNDSVMSTLKSRIDKMSAKAKHCSLLVRSVNLKPNLCYNIKEDKIYGFQDVDAIQYKNPATLGLVVMIRGLFCTWRQPIGYLVISSSEKEKSDLRLTIKTWVEKLITRLFEIGLNLRTLVFSPDDDWITKILCEDTVSPDTPYFFINNKKIFYIFNPPALIKAVHDCLLKHNIHFQNKVANYKDIVNFYNIDQTKTVPYANKLTENHFKFKCKEKLLHTHAIQIMSKTVAHGIWNYINFGFISNGNVGTVEFINNVNNLFDILNVSKQNQKSSDCNTILCKEKSREDLFKDLKNFFQNLKIVNNENERDETSSMTWMNYIQGTLTAINLLQDELKNEGHTAFLTRNLHLTVLNNFINNVISWIKQRPKKPTVLQFTAAFRKVFLKHIQSFTEKGSSENEVLNLLMEMSCIGDKIAQEEEVIDNIPKKQEKPKRIWMNLVKHDYAIIDTPRKHSVMYVSSYLLMKIGKSHQHCEVFQRYLHSQAAEPSLDKGNFQRYNRYVYFKQGDLFEPPCDRFLKLVEQLDRIFVETFANKTIPDKITYVMYCKMIKVSMDHVKLCPCFPKMFMVKLFIRIKMYYIILLNNKSFKIHKNSQKYIPFMIPKLM